MKFSLATILPLALIASVSAQAPGTYVEPKTSISFQTFQDATTGYTFGIALPETPGPDFVGLLVGKGKGWAGLSLGGSMLNKLLIAAWPSGTSIVSSFRKTAKYGNPAEATGSFTMIPIAAGTYTNATHWSYTFVCSGCVLSDGSTFAANATTDVLGWAYNTAAPTTPASHATAFGKHGSQGNYAMTFSSARSAKFASYVAMANKTRTSLKFRA